MGAIINGNDIYVGGGGSATGGTTSSDIQKYFVIGKLCNSNNDTVEGYGVAVVKVLGNTAEIEYNYRISTQGSSGSNFAWGLNPALLQELDSNIPNIKPLSGGTLFVGDSTTDWDYAPLHEATTDDSGGNFWTPSRLYELPNSTGAWTSNKFGSSTFIKGIAHGIIE